MDLRIGQTPVVKTTHSGVLLVSLIGITNIFTGRISGVYAQSLGRGNLTGLQIASVWYSRIHDLNLLVEHKTVMRKFFGADVFDV